PRERARRHARRTLLRLPAGLRMRVATCTRKGRGMSRAVIVGGGIAGLAIGHALKRQSPGVDVVVLEAQASTGGNIRSMDLQGYLCESGPDGFLDNAPATLELVEELGLSKRLLPSNPSARRRFIFLDGKLHEVPLTPGGFLRTRLLSRRGKLRIAAE